MRGKEDYDFRNQIDNIMMMEDDNMLAMRLWLLFRCDVVSPFLAWVLVLVW